MELDISTASADSRMADVADTVSLTTDVLFGVAVPSCVGSYGYSASACRACHHMMKGCRGRVATVKIRSPIMVATSRMASNATVCGLRNGRMICR